MMPYSTELIFYLEMDQPPGEDSRAVTATANVELREGVVWFGARFISVGSFYFLSAHHASNRRCCTTVVSSFLEDFTYSTYFI